MNCLPLGSDYILGIVGIVLTVVFSIATLYQSSLVERIRLVNLRRMFFSEQDDSSEEEKEPPSVLQSTGIILLAMLAFTGLLTCGIKYGLIPLMVWLDKNVSGILYMSAFSWILTTTGVTWYFVWRGRKKSITD